jgi:hypothetical protein
MVFSTLLFIFLININQVKSSIKCPKVVFCKKKIRILSRHMHETKDEFHRISFLKGGKIGV